MPLHIKILIGLVAGVIWALLAAQFGFNEFTMNWIDPFGTIFINVLKLVALPLVLFSIIQGVSGLGDIKKLGSLGIKTLGLYIITTVIAVAIGLTLANGIKPGTFVSENQRIENRKSFDAFLENKGVNNITDPSLAQKFQDAENAKQSKPLQFLVDMVPSNIFKSFADQNLMLQVIFFAIFLGLTMLSLPSEKVKPFSDFVNAGNEIFLKMVDLIMLGSPYFVFALLAGKMTELAGNDINGMVEIFKGLGTYSLTVLLGLAIMVFVIYPGFIHFAPNKINYFQYLKAIRPAQLLAFSTSSSAATLPVTIECVNENLKVSKEVSSFVLPIGATVNMDGTSLYQGVAVVFLAQFHMVDLSLMQQLTILLTATLSSIGAAAVPGAGLVMLIIVLESVGLNPAWIAIIMPVDRILDMCRTVVNVTGDTCVCTLVDGKKYE